MLGIFRRKPAPPQCSAVAPAFRPSLEALEPRSLPAPLMTGSTMLGAFTLPPPRVSPVVAQVAVRLIQQAEAANPQVVLFVQQAPQFLLQGLTFISTSRPMALRAAQQAASDVLFILSQVPPVTMPS